MPHCAEARSIHSLTPAWAPASAAIGAVKATPAGPPAAGPDGLAWTAPADGQIITEVCPGADLIHFLPLRVGQQPAGGCKALVPLHPAASSSPTTLTVFDRAPMTSDEARSARSA